MVVVCGGEAPDDLGEGCYRVVPGADGCWVTWDLYGARGAEWHPTPAIALRSARRYAREYDAAIREIDPDRVRTGWAEDRGMMDLRRLLVDTSS